MAKLLIGIGIAGIVGLIVAAGYAYMVAQPRHGMTTITVGGTRLVVEVADTAAARMTGLSGRDTIGADGMLFLFERPDTYRFWMKGMRFPIDIVWIRDDEVVGIEREVPLAGIIPQTVAPSVPVGVVLELPAGDAARRGIEIGDRVLR